MQTDKIPYRDEKGNILGVIVFAVDITDRKRAEEELKRQRLALEHAVEGLSFLDAEGRYLSVNGSYAAACGYTPQEMVGTPWTRTVHPDDHTKLAHAYAEMLRTGKAAIETRGLRKDGSVFHKEVVMVVVRDEDGALRGHYCFVKDITDRTRAEEDIRRSREQLRALASRLESAREEERTRIARDIHDELGQALTALNMDLSWIRSRLPQSKPLAPLHEKALAMAGLITHTIESVRRIATELRPGVLDQLGLVAALEWQAATFQTRYGIACRLELPAGEIELNAQRSTALFRMLQEALTNVVRHADATSISITLDKTDTEVRLTVEDNGKGLSQESLATMQSLGIMGLRERAMALGGALRLQGIPGRGTIVEVSLPLIREGSHNADNAEEMPHPDRG